MRFDAIETVSPLDLKSRCPIVLTSSKSRLAAIAHAVILLPACLVMLVPFALVAAFAAEQPDPFSALADKPMAAVQIGLAFLLAGALLALAVDRLAARLGGGAKIEIDAERVRVVTHGLLKSESWQAPLASFTGVAHRVRSTLSGTRHELVLVHPETSKSLLVEIAPRIAEARIADVCRHFGLPQIIAGRAVPVSPAMRSGASLPIAA